MKLVCWRCLLRLADKTITEDEFNRQNDRVTMYEGYVLCMRHLRERFGF